MSDRLSPAEKFDFLLRKREELDRLREPERQRIAAHAPDCYNPYHCQSCGCDRRGAYGDDGPRACVSHMNSNAYLADVNLRLAKALEAQAKR
jgi:hypothetical protein